jgi:hypothetical protein
MRCDRVVDDLAPRVTADEEDQVRLGDYTVRTPARVGPHDAYRQRMVVGDGPLAIEGCCHRNGQPLGQFTDFGRRLGGRDAPARDDHRPLRPGQDTSSLSHPIALWLWPEGGILQERCFNDQFQVPLFFHHMPMTAAHLQVDWPRRPSCGGAEGLPQQVG